MLCLLSVRTNSLFHSGDIFSGLFSLLQMSLGQPEKARTARGGKKKEGEKRGRRGNDVRESRRKTNNKTKEKSCGAEVRRAGEPPLLSSPPEDTGGEVGVLALKKLIQLDRTSQQRHVESERSTPPPPLPPSSEKKRESERHRAREREGKKPLSPALRHTVSPSSLLSGHRAVPPPRMV